MNRLLHEERSFSGHEKNCAFLSMRNGQFASISSVSGLDFNDDSRALALCDWDFDGKLDLWMSARTAPRVRFVHNQTATNGRFVAVQLRGNGTTTNRDAIGARVAVVTDIGDEKNILTLHAGDGFLAQSSRWLHFGLGDAESIKSIRVSWPGGKTESFRPVEVNQFYVISQDTAEVVAWQPSEPRRELVARKQTLPTSLQIARIVPPYRLPLPGIDYVTNGSGEQRLPIEEPTLVCIWSASCNHCIHELTEWSKEPAAFRERGLNVVAINADLDASPAEVEQREVLLQRMSFAFPSYSPTEETVRQLDYFQRALMDLWQPMPVPCSFLVDRMGQVVAIYKGPVELATIWSDLSLLEADPEQIREAAVPFAGRWGTEVPKADPTRVSSQMIDHTLINGAIDYLQSFVDTAAKAGSTISQLKRADVKYVQSVLLESQGRTDEALRALESSRSLNPNDFRVRTDLAKFHLKRRDFESAEPELVAAVQINPSDIRIRRDLGVALLQQGKLLAAIEQFKLLLQQQPDDPQVHFHLATAQRRSGHWAAAMKSYQRALDIQPNFLLAANNLAWILATHPDETLRNGTVAVQLAERICQQTKFTQPTLLDTLAAAYAEVGEFDKAVETVDRAISLIESGPKAMQDASISQRRELYMRQRPYRDKSWLVVGQ